MPPTASISDPKPIYFDRVPPELDLVRGFVTLALSIDAELLDAVVERALAQGDPNATATAKAIRWAAGRG